LIPLGMKRHCSGKEHHRCKKFFHIQYLGAQS
jgi:hypothetical protein